MSKKTTWFLGIVTILILIFLWRQNNAEKNYVAQENAQEVNSEIVMEEKKEGKGQALVMEENKKMEETKKHEDSSEKKEVMTSDKLVLTAEAMGSGKVKLSWQAPSGLDESNRFIIIRDDEENPVHNPEKNYWIRKNHLQSETIWEDTPTGTWHFRMCLTKNNEKDTCTEYSNNVSVEVK